MTHNKEKESKLLFNFKNELCNSKFVLATRKVAICSPNITVHTHMMANYYI